MIYPPPPPPYVPRLHRRSLYLAMLSGLAFVLAGLAFVLLMVNAQTRLGRGAQAAAFIQYAWIAGVVALIQVPALAYSLARLAGKPIPAFNSPWLGLRGATLLLVVGWPMAIIGGAAIGRPAGLVSGLLAWPLQALAVGIPLWWLVQFSRRGLVTGTAQRGWGIGSFSTAVTVPFIIIFESIGAIALVVLVMFTLFAREPRLLAELQRLTDSMGIGRTDPSEIIKLLEPYFNRSALSFGLLATIAGLAPLAEELLKPLALWLLVRKDFTPAQGFAAGAAAGACFALVESLSNTSSFAGGGATWVLVIAARAGTGIIHITCSALVGWGLGEAWGNRRYLRLGGFFLLAVVIHGTWNALALGPALQTLLGDGADILSLGGLSAVSGVGLVVLLAGSFGILWFGNRKLQTTHTDTVVTEIEFNHGGTNDFAQQNRTEEEQRIENREESDKPLENPGETPDQNQANQ